MPARRCGAVRPKYQPQIFVPRALAVRDIRAWSSSMRWPTRRGVTAAALTTLMLTILPLAGETAPPWPVLTIDRVAAHGEHRATALPVPYPIPS